MTEEQINAAIAETCGWKVDKRGFGWLNPHGCYAECPNYCADLNAMHEAEKVLTGYEQIATYVWHLENRPGDWSTDEHMMATDEHMMATHATARQRAEAFLRTLGKWEENAK